MHQTEQPFAIHKAAGVLLRDGGFLVTRSKGKSFFVAPGGKVEAGESVSQALMRELEEELGVAVRETDLLPLGTFYAPAAGSEDKMLRMDVLMVGKWEGDVVASAEVDEVRWIDSESVQEIELGSIFLHDVLPILKAEHLIK